MTHPFLLLIVILCCLALPTDISAVDMGGFKVPPGFKPKAGTASEPYTNTGYAKEIVDEVTGMEFVFIPAGTFEMGSDWKIGMGESPKHPVRITKPFYFGKYMVTRAQWQAVMGTDLKETLQEPIGYQANASKRAVPLAAPWTTHKGKIEGAAKEDATKFPAATGSWDIAKIFLERYNKKLGANVLVRMPTEAEYEYACRAGTKTEFFYGNDIYTKTPVANTELRNECKDLIKYAWYDNLWANYKWNQPLPPEEKAIQVYHEVGKLLPNPWGLYDIMGNLWHYCSDWHSSAYYGECLKKGMVDDPKGPDSDPSGIKVIRGGYTWHPACYCRSASRDHYRPDVDWGYGGVRVVLEIPGVKGLK